VVVDASEGISVLDAAISGMALDFGLSVVIAVNKWDKMHGDDADDKWSHLERTTDLKMDFIKWCPWVRISAMTGKGIGELLKTVKKVTEARSQRVQTSLLNQIFERRVRLHNHPLGPNGRVAKFYYLSQVGINPPEFVLFTNIPGPAVHFSFKRFLVNTLRDEFKFIGTPIRLHFKLAHKDQNAPKYAKSSGSRGREGRA
jgi:GTPase